MYHSEHGQDKWLNEFIFHNQRGGTFVEFGAIDGIITSNTLFYEKELDWNGVLIEANPVNFAKLLDSGRRAIKVQAAVGPHWAPLMSFTHVPAVAGWGGLSATIEKEHLERIQSYGGGVDFLMPVTPLDDILRTCGVKAIDYLSVDVEGGEYDALRDFDFGAFPTRIVDVEDNFGSGRVHEIMERHGFVLVKQLEINRIYQSSATPDAYHGIPKKIHFIWLGSPAPDWALVNVGEFKKLNPDFDVILHEYGDDLAQARSELIPDLEEAWDLLGPGEHEMSMRSDLLRLSILKKEGGWYVDTDFWPLAPISEICSDLDASQGKVITFATSQEERENREVMANGFIGCRPGAKGLDPIIAIIKDTCKKARDWWSYGTWPMFRAEQLYPSLFKVGPLEKILPVKERAEAIRAARDPDERNRLRALGAYAIHFHNQDRLTLE